MAVATAPPAAHDFRPTKAGIAARATVAVLIAAVVLLLPVLLDSTWDRQISLAAIYAIIGLSINVITGHAGQISLGHQAFVGIGAFMASFVGSKLGLIPFAPMMPTANFFIGMVAAGVTGAGLALLLGVVALRIRGLYLALITLAFGLMAETAIFNWRAFTGGGAGAQAPRPASFQSEQSYAYLSLALLAVFLLVDWRLVKSKAGRAIVALRNDERVAATLGINVTGYKLLAFVVAGTLAGIAGTLLAHRTTSAQAQDFRLQVALVWVIMTVVGGLGSRAGVVIGSSFFAMFTFLFDALGLASETGTIDLPFFGPIVIETLVPLLGAFLLLLTLTLYPGGIGQQLLPLRRWLAGGPFLEHTSHRRARRPRKPRRPARAPVASPAAGPGGVGGPPAGERVPSEPSGQPVPAPAEGGPDTRGADTRREIER